MLRTNKTYAAVLGESDRAIKKRIYDGLLYAGAGVDARPGGRGIGIKISDHGGKLYISFSHEGSIYHQTLSGCFLDISKTLNSFYNLETDGHTLKETYNAINRLRFGLAMPPLTATETEELSNKLARRQKVITFYIGIHKITVLKPLSTIPYRAILELLNDLTSKADIYQLVSLNRSDSTFPESRIPLSKSAYEKINETYALLGIPRTSNKTIPAAISFETITIEISGFNVDINRETHRTPHAISDEIIRQCTEITTPSQQSQTTKEKLSLLPFANNCHKTQSSPTGVADLSMQVTSNRMEETCVEINTAAVGQYLEFIISPQTTETPTQNARKRRGTKPHKEAIDISKVVTEENMRKLHELILLHTGKQCLKVQAFATRTEIYIKIAKEITIKLTRDESINAKLAYHTELLEAMYGIKHHDDPLYTEKLRLEEDPNQDSDLDIEPTSTSTTKPQLTRQDDGSDLLPVPVCKTQTPSNKQVKLQEKSEQLFKRTRLRSPTYYEKWIENKHYPLAHNIIACLSIYNPKTARADPAYDSRQLHKQIRLELNLNT